MLCCICHSLSHTVGACRYLSFVLTPSPQNKFQIFQELQVYESSFSYCIQGRLLNWKTQSLVCLELPETNVKIVSASTHLYCLLACLFVYIACLSICYFYLELAFWGPRLGGLSPGGSYCLALSLATVVWISSREGLTSCLAYVLQFLGSTDHSSFSTVLLFFCETSTTQSLGCQVMSLLEASITVL